MKLHIGCGKRYLDGFKHVDKCKFDHIDYICDILELNTCFEENSIDEIYACHVFEHIGRNDIDSCLSSLYNILKPGGIIRIAVPDIEKVIKLYNSGTPLFPTLYGLLWGGQKNELDYHSIGFDFKTISFFLSKHGFDQIDRYDWKTFLPDQFDDYSRCYIPHMDFDNGELMSLNVIAKKKCLVL